MPLPTAVIVGAKATPITKLRRRFGLWMRLVKIEPSFRKVGDRFILLSTVTYFDSWYEKYYQEHFLLTVENSAVRGDTALPSVPDIDNFFLESGLDIYEPAPVSSQPVESSGLQGGATADGSVADQRDDSQPMFD